MHPVLPEPLNPESARVHALIAARRAMDRSSGSTSEDFQRSDSSAGKRPALLPKAGDAFNESPATQLHRQRSILQANSPGLASPLPILDGRVSEREGQFACNQTTTTEFGGSFNGEPSSYRRLQRARSVLNPSRG